MPFYHSDHFHDAIDVVNNLKIPHSTIWINNIYDAFYDTGHLWKSRAKENLMARIRMCLLYAFANEHDLLVVGTSNLIEIQTGYFTKFGDGGNDIEPIGKCSKHHIYALAGYFNEINGNFIIPEKVIMKQPTAELHPDQLDTDDIGPYHIADRIIEYIAFGKNDISDIDQNDVNKIMDLVRLSSHKREMASIPIMPDEENISKDRFLKILGETVDSGISDSKFRLLVRNTLGVVK